MVLGRELPQTRRCNDYLVVAGRHVNMLTRLVRSHHNITGRFSLNSPSYISIVQRVTEIVPHSKLLTSGCSLHCNQRCHIFRNNWKLRVNRVCLVSVKEMSGEWENTPPPQPGRSNEPVDFRSNWGMLRGKQRLWVPSSVLCVKLHSLGSCSEWLSVRNTEKEQPPRVFREEYYGKVQFPGDTFVLCKRRLRRRWKSWVFLFGPGSISSAEETAGKKKGKGKKKISLMMLPIPQINATDKKDDSLEEVAGDCYEASPERHFAVWLKQSVCRYK